MKEEKKFTIDTEELKSALKHSNWEIILCLTLIFLLFQKGFEIFVIDLLETFPDSSVESSILTDIILLLFLIFIPLKIFKGFKVSTNVFLLSNLVVLVFIKVRYSPYSLSFLKFKIFDQIQYIDLFWLVYLIICISWIRQFRLKKFTKSPFFNEDFPLLEKAKDELHFKDYAKEISDKIDIGTYNKSFAIGINGKWGSGKTSFLNLIVEELALNKNNIIINFNPWNYKSTDLLTMALFDLISNTVKPYDKNVGKEIINYANKLIGTTDNQYLSFAKNALDLTSSDKSIIAIQENIDKQLRNIDRKLIITIDDLDRLHYEEINSILKLVRNTANFHNTVFFLLYDKNYISKAIEHLNPINCNEYIEKIIQLEINIPVYESTIIKGNLLNKLKKSLPTELNEELDSIFLTSNFQNDYIGSLIKNLRDVNRLMNSVTLNYSKLHGEVIFADFFKIEILRIKLPNVYDLLKHEQRYYLNTEVKNERHGYILAKTAKNNIDHYLIYDKIVVLYPGINAESVISFLELIFTESRATHYNNSKRLSIIYPSNFNRYFRYLITSNELSESSFSDARQKGFEELKVKIDYWVEHKLISELKYLFESIEFYDDDNDYDNIIKSIFYFANIKQPNNPFETSIGFNDINILNKLKLLGESGSNDKAKEYFTALVKGSFSSQNYIFRLMNNMLSNGYEDYIIAKDELLTIYLDQLQHIITRIPAPNKEFWKIYNTLRKTKKWTKSGNVSTGEDALLDEVTLMIKDRFLKFDIDFIIPILIDFNRPNGGELKKLNDTFIDEIFGNKLFFDDYVNSIKDEKSKYISEFLVFYGKVKENKYNYIKFNLSVIKDDDY